MYDVRDGCSFEGNAFTAALESFATATLEFFATSMFSTSNRQMPICSSPTR